jgi:dolichol-phosphate mannosyltransferase
MITIVVPCCNEQEAIPHLYDRLSQAAQSWGEDYEVIAVDDGSIDNTLDLLEEIHRRDPRWKIISFSRNFGHQVAISAGMQYAKGDCVVLIDADLQDPPEQINNFLAEWRKSYEVVYAQCR